LLVLIKKFRHRSFKFAIAHDKGKPAAKQGRKAKSLRKAEDSLAAEGDRKAPHQGLSILISSLEVDQKACGIADPPPPSLP
jgi:hypothetical protein